MINELAAASNLQIAPVFGEPYLSATRPQSGQFADALIGQLTQLDESLKASSILVERAALGEPVSPHQVMIALEEARLHFSLAMQVRNRLLEAYQELTRMQV